MRSSFFIASGKHEVFDILHGLGLAFFVELIEGVQQLCLGGSKDAVAFFEEKYPEGKVLKIMSR